MLNKHYFLISVGTILFILKLLADFLTHALGQDKETRVRAELKSWRDAASKNDSRDPVFLPLFQVPARLLTRIFGPRPLSLRALWVTAFIASLLLIISVSLGIIFYGFNSPAKSLGQSLDVLQKTAATLAAQLPADNFQYQRNASDLVKMRGSGYGAAYTAYYYLITFAVTSLFSFLTLAFCRRLLQTATQVRDLFSLFLVLLSNGVVAVFLLGLQCSLLTILLYPCFWPAVPLFLQVFGHSPIVGLVFTLIGGICAPIFYWLASDSWLRMAVVLSLLPCLLVGILILLNLLTRPFRQPFCACIVSFFDMTLGSRKGIFSFFSFCFAVSIPLCSVTVWLAQLRLTPLVVGSLFVLSLLAQVKYSLPQKVVVPQYLLTVVLFAGGLVIVGTGYYLQAILDCFRIPSSTPPASLADPFFSSLIPGALVGLLFVHNRVSRGGFWKLTLGFLLITTSVDFSRTILGYFPYSEFIVAILCNVVGAPFAALVTSYSTTLLFPEKKQKKAGSAIQPAAR